MNTTQPLPDHPTWKKLLLSAEGSIGKNWSFYEDPEPRLCGHLLEDYHSDMDALANQALELLEKTSKEKKADGNAWAVLKEGATLLHHLQKKGYSPEDDWEHAIDVLWKAMGEFGQGSWSAFVQAGNNEVRPRAWKQEKFVVDAILTTLYQLPGDDESRIQRFFNSKMSRYWKSYVVFWEEIWGKFKDGRKPYFQAWDYRANQKLTTYRLLCYRLQNFETEFAAHPNKPREAFDYLNGKRDEIPVEKKIRREIYFALFKFLRESGEENSLEEDLATIKNILGGDDVFEFLIQDGSLSRAERGGMLLLSFKEDLDTRWKVNIKYQQRILPDLMAALKHDELDVREKAVQFLQSYPTELFKYLRYVENLEGEEKKEDDHQAFKLIARVFGEDTAKKLVENISFTPLQKGKLLLSTPRVLEARWDAKDYPNHDTLLPVILAAVEDGDPTVQESASNFLKRKSADIQRKLDILMTNLQDEDKTSEMIVSGIEFGSDAALKTILGKCASWVASDQNATLVDRAAQKARYTPAAVLALINLLNNRQDFQIKDEEVRKYVRRRVLEEQQNPTLSRVFSDGKLSDQELDSHTTEEIYKWCYSQKEQSKAYADLVSSQEENIRKKDGVLIPRRVFDLAKSILKLQEQNEMKERELVVQKWITQLLSEMSDRWFFEDKMDIYAQIKSQLERLAIEPLSKRLPQEENLDIRENLVKILGNIGGRVAVDALVRTVTGEERERAARQELLSEYYLKPSKARSEEASILLNDAVDNAKKTMRLLQQLNVATFAMGAILIMGGVIISVASQELGGRVTGVLAGLGGLAAILTQFLKDPLERIQRAMADLVQVQTAFTSFVWELNLNGTYIQSQYVAEGILTDFDLRQTIGRIDHAMERTMHLIHVYADGQDLKQPPQLHYLVQNSGKPGSTVTIFGQSLLGTKERSDKDKFQLAINHQPTDAHIETWTDQMVMFSLDGNLLGKSNGSPRLWASLLLNGIETNALPFTVEAAAIEKPKKESPVEAPKELPKAPVDMPKVKG
ncbi:MAG: hypothetical protein H6557_21005 [Lewinellaceae bacterium]|nr:hypothetical protein [Phaeodactylibacter sp.]MCB9039099.1 hypothetical protein [Lewinellaceae bacterium]